MTEPNQDPQIPDSFSKAPLIETISQEVLKELKKNGFLLPQEVSEILTALKDAAARLEKEKITTLIAKPAPPKLPERWELRADIESKLDDLESAKGDFIVHCFKVMLCEGITWRDIFIEISSVVPGNEKETIEHLKALESLPITASDFY